jgi:hypothetical protein
MLIKRLLVSKAGSILAPGATDVNGSGSADRDFQGSESLPIGVARKRVRA